MAPVSPLAPHGATTRIGKSGSGHFPRQPKIPGRDQEFGVSPRRTTRLSGRSSPGCVSRDRDVNLEARPLSWLALGTAYALFTSWVERQFSGAVGPDFAMTLAARCLLAARVVWFYALKLLWPADLNTVARGAGAA